MPPSLKTYPVGMMLYFHDPLSGRYEFLAGNPSSGMIARDSMPSEGPKKSRFFLLLTENKVLPLGLRANTTVEKSNYEKTISTRT
jgi:hypothetical protein